MSPLEAVQSVVRDLRAHLSLTAKLAQDPELAKAASTMLAALNNGKPLAPVESLPPHE